MFEMCSTRRGFFSVAGAAGVATALPALPKARHAFGAATVGNVAYFAGGAPVCGGGAMTEMLSLTLSKP